MPRGGTGWTRLCLKGGGEGRGDTHDPPPTGAGGQALPCDPPEGDPGKEGGAGFRARILVERKHGVGREREMKDPTSPPSQTVRPRKRQRPLSRHTDLRPECTALLNPGGLEINTWKFL